MAINFFATACCFLELSLEAWWRWYFLRFLSAVESKKISEHLFSEVVKTTSAEAKNSSLVGDVNAPHACGKPNKQKSKKQAKKTIKVKSRCEPDV
ncbi:hypothetical protein V2J09_013334 [Rumex salicifolius]